MKPLKSSKNIYLYKKKVRIKTGEALFSYNQIPNNLPKGLSCAPTLTAFKRRLKPSYFLLLSHAVFITLFVFKSLLSLLSQHLLVLCNLIFGLVSEQMYFETASCVNCAI